MPCWIVVSKLSRVTCTVAMNVPLSAQ